MAYDDILRKIGGNRHEFKMFAIFFFNGIPNALITIGLVFTQYMPEVYRCALPDAVNTAMEKVR